MLSPDDLINLIRSVFPLHPDDHCLGILVDVPRNPEDDNSDWKERRQLAEDWYHDLKSFRSKLSMDDIYLFAYADVGSNNADLPEFGYQIKRRLPSQASELQDSGTKASFSDIFTRTQIFLAPTQYSTTAPLKVAAKTFQFRAATMPGFSRQMIPALKIDYAEINRRVLALKEKLDRAQAAEVHFRVDNHEDFQMYFDLRNRLAHASTGRFPEKGTAGNLPSGEAYIVPYEGEKAESSQTAGTLPVQIGEDIVLFNVKANRATYAEGDSDSAQKENQRLQQDPAYGNMAELGFGVLADFGIQPIDKILLDEKLGFHIAFGRSEHFGGAVGPDDFASPEDVIHLDRIYIPATQPKIHIKSIILFYAQSQGEIILEDNKYLVF